MPPLIEMSPSVPVFTVFIQGLVSFFSPCIFPLLPVYMGYLAGGTYTVTEDDNWTWRWESADSKKDITGASHEVSTVDPHESDHVEEVSFSNRLKERIGKLWLSFCTMVANIFQKGGSF